MPDREVKTIRDLIFYQYAKIIAKSAMGPDSKKNAYGFIKTKFRELRDNEMKWSDILREDKQFAESEKKCAYCGSTENLQWEHIVPKSLLINDSCPTCDHIQGIHNQVWACKSCNSKKGTKGLYRFMKELHPDVKPFSDCVPPLLEKKYLKTIWYCHQCKGTLDWDGGGKKLEVFDLDFPCGEGKK
ncbi:HNH endonuclease [Sediminispirochaeta smaragdinae]|uniref:HNH endonuclease n=1 Tax=Sediminispirochaeta smaragdinae (strain DSM 11293 / JCM 15392 / SEBR 4228) TaxID=573413 RepID=E1RA48_SEDSS|nr:HNH endonuclease [Sediminispirochaeta smaragdinae]ADK83367.1 HNH endonuclease [Sediminispirochaeta smaragdinae DSM 11293]